jgi:predicted nuclease of predicted toxin-antitoxin system
VNPTLPVNENFPVPALKRLREAGVAVMSVQEAMSGASDPEVMAHARASGWWIVTYDKDYGALVFKRGEPAPPAILYLKQEPYPPAEAADVVLAVLASADRALGQFVTASTQSIRMRALP